MLAIHPVTKRMLEAAEQTTPHALLLTGPVGVGLNSIAEFYAHQSGAVLQRVLPTKDGVIDYEKGVISVEHIRDLYDSTKTREPKGRIILIDGAERMGIPAQNAFLKLLEEPIEGTRFFLLSHASERLLSTITSRAQHVAVRPLSLADTEVFLDTLKVKETTKRAQLLFIAEGLPAELSRLVENEAVFNARVDIIKDARTFISGSPYERLTVAQRYKDNRQDALLLLTDATKQLRRTVAEKGDESLLQAIRQIERAHQSITDQGNVRLHLVSACLA